MSDLLASFGKPFAYQVAAYRLRLLQLAPTTGWDKEIWKVQHDRAFMVAGAMKADILADLAAMVDKAIAQGGTLEEFRRDFRSMVEKKGWQISKPKPTDPEDPDKLPSKGYEAWRTKVIYKTNMATSRAAGCLAQLRAGGFKFFVYSHGASLEPREQHLAWDGLVLEADHPFWNTHAPPNGWGCSCYLTGARSRESAHRVGGKPEKQLPDGWNTIDAETGAPSGISKGWDYSPGASVSEMISAMATKTVHWPYEVAKAFMSSLPDANRDALAMSYRSLPSTEAAVDRFALAALLDDAKLAAAGQSALADYVTLGLLTDADAAIIKSTLGKSVDGFDFALSKFAVRHVVKQHGDELAEGRRGQIAISAADFRYLLETLNNPDEVTDDAGRIVVTKVIDKGTLRAIFERLAKRRMISLVTFMILK